jgi:hypothetical protein
MTMLEAPAGEVEDPEGDLRKGLGGDGGLALPEDVVAALATRAS